MEQHAPVRQNGGKSRLIKRVDTEQRTVQIDAKRQAQGSQLTGGCGLDAMQQFRQIGLGRVNDFLCRLLAGRGKLCAVPCYASATGSRLARTLSTRRPSISSTSNRQPEKTMRSPTRGTRRKSARTRPAS